MRTTNPYNNRGILPIDSDMFFGREKEMQRIEGLLSTNYPQCISIVGERRIGKSSLAYRIFHKIKQSENTLAVYLDCDGLADECKTKDQFFQQLNQNFLEVINNKSGLKTFLGKEEDNFFNTYTTFKAFIKRISMKEIKTIIFFDEFEHLPREENKNAFADDTFFSNLRAMANKPDNRLAFVTITKIGLKELTHKSIQSSGFWNIFKAEIIGLLDNEKTECLREYGFKKYNVPLSEDITKKIFYFSGDFAFFNQMVCGFIWDSNTNLDSLEWDNLEVVLLPYYEKLWEDRTKEEQKLLKNAKNIKIQDELALKEMRARGIVIKEKDKYIPFSDYFSHLIETFFFVSRKKIMESTKDMLDTALKARKVIHG